MEGVPTLESLESRQMLAVITWDGGPAGTGTNFDTAENWVGDIAPGPSDTAVIDTVGSAIVVGSGTRAVAGLHSIRDVQFNSGSLTTTGTNVVSAVVRLQSGALLGGTWSFSGPGSGLQVTTTGTLVNTTILSDITVGAGLTLTFTGSTRFGAVRMTGNNSRVNFNPGFVLQDEIVAEGADTGTRSIYLANLPGGGTNTISSTGVIRLAAGAGGDLNIRQGTSGGIVSSLINNGQLINQASGRTLSVTNLLNGMANNGSVRAVAGTIFLNTPFTSPGQLIGVTGNLDIGGTFNAAGTTRTLSATTGSLNMRGGTINGGEFTFADGALIRCAPGNGGTLNDVFMVGDLTLGVGEYLVFGGSTRFSTVHLNGGARVSFAAGFTLQDAVVADGASTIIAGVSGAGLSTIGPTGVIRLAAGTSGGLNIEQAGTVTMVNNGLISAEASGQKLLFRFSTNGFANNGTIVAVAGIVELGSTFTNAGTISGVTGSVIISGTLNATGTVQNLNASTGSWTLQSGSIVGGTFNMSDGMVLRVVNLPGSTTAILDGVTLAGDVVVESSSRVEVGNGTRFAAVRLASDNAYLYTAFGYTLRDRVIAEGSGPGTRYVFIGDLLIASGGEVRLASGVGGPLEVRFNNNATLTNEGLISAEAAGQFLRIGQTGDTLINRGTLRATAGTLQPNLTLTNTGTMIGVTGSLVLAGTFNAAGTVQTLNETTGSWILNGVTINGGEFHLSGGAFLLATASEARLNAVTILGDVILDDTARLTLLGETRFNTIRLKGDVRLTLSAGYVLRDEIIAEGDAFGIRTVATSGAVAIAPTGVVRLMAESAGPLQFSPTTGLDLTNDGLIVSESPGQILSILCGTTNNGIIRASAGAVNIGRILLNNGLLDGRTGSIDISGTFNAAGTIQTLNAATGSWNLRGGTINGGEFRVLDGTSIRATAPGSSLNDVNIVGDVLVNESCYLTVSGTTRFHTVRLLGLDATIRLATGYVLNDDVVAEGSAAGNRYVVIAQGAVGSNTISQSGLIHLASNSGGPLVVRPSVTGTLVNNGTISTTSTQILLLAQNMQLMNNGEIQSLGQSTLRIVGTSFTNAGVLRSASGSVRVESATPFVNQGLLDIRPGGVITIAGVGGFTNAANGEVRSAIAGTASTAFGRLQVESGNVSLDGVLTVSIDIGVMIPVLSQFDIISAPSNRTINGEFSTINLPPPAQDGKNFTMRTSNVYSFGYSSLADYNNDLNVDFFDYLDFVAGFASFDPRNDINGDQIVDFFDYLDFVAIFSQF